MPKDPRHEFLQVALAKVRQDKKLKQSEIAAYLGKPQSFVSKYESGERRLNVIEFLDVCKALSIDPAKILNQINS